LGQGGKLLSLMILVLCREYRMFILIKKCDYYQLLGRFKNRMVSGILG
jgi:hypothetical protein